MTAQAHTAMADALAKAGVRTSKTVRRPAAAKTSTEKKPRAPRTKKLTSAQHAAQIDREIESLISYLHR